MSLFSRTEQEPDAEHRDSRVQTAEPEVEATQTEQQPQTEQGEPGEIEAVADAHAPGEIEAVADAQAQGEEADDHRNGHGHGHGLDEPGDDPAEAPADEHRNGHSDVHATQPAPIATPAAAPPAAAPIAEPARDQPPQAPAPRMTVAEALRRSWLLVLLPAVLLAAAGAYVAHSRPQSYTAEARLGVGHADPSSPAFGGFVTAASQLAGVYSRAINSPDVVGPVSRQLHYSPATVRGRLGATPVQDSPIIRVLGTAPTASGAQAVANSGADALTKSITAANRNNQDTLRLDAQYHALSLQKAANDELVSRAHKQLSNDPSNASLKSYLARVTAWGQTLGLRLTAVGGAYTASESAQASTQVLYPLAPATSASSDRSSKMQTYGGAGLLAGLVIGVALAMWRAGRALRRSAA